MSNSDDGAELRLDKWLWAARFFKTRSLAAEAIDGGKIEVNEERAKRSRALRLGDQVRVRKPPFEQIVIVRGLSDVRRSGAEAATLYEETAESRAEREKLATQFKAIGASVFRDSAGRPSKKERRDIDRWRKR